ncbi:MAG TPA: hypothetical protein ENI23_09315 [bacterium]|nr:hypothetical protein [bacterium]
MDVNIIALLSCPKCNVEPEVFLEHWDNHGEKESGECYSVGCFEYGSHYETIQFDNEEDARKAWNWYVTNGRKKPKNN